MAAQQNSDPTTVIESLLFVASGPVPIGRIAKTLDITPKTVEKHLYDLQEQYLVRGLNLQWTTEGVQLTSAPENADQIEQFLGLETTTRLSPAVLEVLSIVSYMQPVTRPQIDRIRGVNSDGSLRKLLTFNLIEELGRQDTPGRPILYGTTPEFLQQFGLDSLDQLPALPTDEVDDDMLSDILSDLQLDLNEPEPEDSSIESIIEAVSTDDASTDAPS